MNLNNSLGEGEGKSKRDAEFIKSVCTTISPPHFSRTGSNKIKMSPDSSFPVQVRLRDFPEESGLHLFEDLKHPLSCEDMEAAVVAKNSSGRSNVDAT